MFLFLDHTWCSGYSWLCTQESLLVVSRLEPHGQPAVLRFRPTKSIFYTLSCSFLVPHRPQAEESSGRFQQHCYLSTVYYFSTVNWGAWICWLFPWYLCKEHYTPLKGFKIQNVQENTISSAVNIPENQFLNWTSPIFWNQGFNHEPKRPHVLKIPSGAVWQPDPDLWQRLTLGGGGCTLGQQHHMWTLRHPVSSAMLPCTSNKHKAAHPFIQKDWSAGGL